MIKEGNAEIEAWIDARMKVTEGLRNTIEDKAFWRALPTTEGEDFGGWTVYAVKGVMPTDHVGNWCGCRDWVAKPPFDETGELEIGLALFHDHTKESIARVIMVWDHNFPTAGMVIATDSYETMKSFFGAFRNEEEHPSIKRHLH